ncbi:immunoglobulin E-set [Chlamydoabsidia padenii]|nr:immunoglobulin E-set [Chlamydoabsidia padenii]
MAKNTGTTPKHGRIKSWMTHLFTKSNKKETNNIRVTTTGARSTNDSLSEKNTTGSISVVDSIARSSSTTTTRSSSVHNSSKCVTTIPYNTPETIKEAPAPQPTVSATSSSSSSSPTSTSSTYHKKEDTSQQVDQQPSDDIPAPIEVYWKHGGQDVYVTGTFDDWKKSVRMDKQTDGNFVARLPPNDHTMWYKFVVDGIWKHDDDQPNEKDKDGNTNNVIHV